MTSVRAAVYLVVAAALLGGCTSRSETTTAPPSPPPASEKASSVREAVVAPSPFHVVEHYETHPDEAPLVVQQSQVVLDEKLRGWQSIKTPDLSRYRDVTLFLTCDVDVAYRVVLGTVQKPDATPYGGTSCGGGPAGSCTVDVSPTDPFTRITVEVGTGVGYYLTMYGEPLDAPARDDG